MRSFHFCFERTSLHAMWRIKGREARTDRKTGYCTLQMRNDDDLGQVLAVEVMDMELSDGLTGCGDVTGKVESRMSPIFLT